MLNSFFSYDKSLRTLNKWASGSLIAGILSLLIFITSAVIYIIWRSDIVRDIAIFSAISVLVFIMMFGISVVARIAVKHLT